MWPVLFRIGDFEIATFGFMVAIGVFAAYLVGVRRARDAGLPEEGFSNVIVLSVLFAFVGAKIFHVLVYMGEAPAGSLLLERSGFILYGGLIFGVLAGLFLVLRKGWDWRVVADVVAPAIPLGQFFGRIGCFLNGCCYGAVCPGPMGIRFPRMREEALSESGDVGFQIIGSEPYRHHLDQMLVTIADPFSLPVYPTQILSALQGLLTFCLLHFYLSKRTRFRGQLFLLYLIIYSVGRFGVEALRADPRGAWPGGLSTSQGISIAVLAVAVVLWALLKGQKEAPDGLTKEHGIHSS